jgi:hypothetical protein
MDLVFGLLNIQPFALEISVVVAEFARVSLE